MRSFMAKSCRPDKRSPRIVAWGLSQRVGDQGRPERPGIVGENAVFDELRHIDPAQVYVVGPECKTSHRELLPFQRTATRKKSASARRADFVRLRRRHASIRDIARERWSLGDLFVGSSGAGGDATVVKADAAAGRSE